MYKITSEFHKYALYPKQLQNFVTPLFYAKFQLLIKFHYNGNKHVYGLALAQLVKRLHHIRLVLDSCVTHTDRGAYKYISPSHKDNAGIKTFTLA